MLLVALKWLLAIAVGLSGVMHFTSPRAYLAMMPKWLPAHRALVLISGFFEIAGAVGLVIPATQQLAAWGLIALFIAVLPANVNMAVNRLPLAGKPVPTWALWLRLPLQLVFIGWAWLFTR
jgi:uncharacterized membrane protein